MWKGKEKAPVREFLICLSLIVIVINIAIFILEPYSIAFANSGVLTKKYLIYAIVGIVLSTPSPMIATYITLKRKKNFSSLKDFSKRIFNSPSPLKSMLIIFAFCAVAFVIALFYGNPNGSPWYLMPLSLPLLIIGGGIEEIGWRGFLQPSLEEKFPFPIATIITSGIWVIWHLPLWFLPTSNHYNDSFIGFAIFLFAWGFALAAIYKLTKCVFACVMYHAFINSIGAIYDWNSLFDTFPNRVGIYVYYFVLVVASIFIWTLADKKERRELALS